MGMADRCAVRAAACNGGAWAALLSYPGLMICASAYVLLRTMLWTGANVFVSLVLTLLYVGGSSVHHHARPHVWTLLLFALSAGLLARDRKEAIELDLAADSLTVIWTNLARRISWR